MTILKFQIFIPKTCIAMVKKDTSRNVAVEILI